MVDGGTGQDDIETGVGADQINVADGERDVVHCGLSTDTVEADVLDEVEGCEMVNIQ